MEDIDIGRTARDFIDKYDMDASHHAMEQLKAMMKRRDIEGAAVWTRVIGAITMLQRRHPRTN